MTLYERSDCPFCWKVRIALAELELDYRSEAISLGEKHADVARLSPTGTVPVLVDGEVAIWESAVIMEYLDSRYGSGRLMAGTEADQARIRLLHAYSDKLVGPCLRELVFEKRSKPEREWDAQVIADSEAKWQSCQAYLAGELGDGPFFGNDFSAADCAVAARCGVAAAYGSAVGGEHPGLHDWFERVTSRASWERAYPSSFIRTR